MKYFTAGIWQPLPVVTNLFTQKITTYPGYMIFVRGSRGVDLTFATGTIPDNTSLRSSGYLNVANVAPVSFTSTGLTCVGNPFASSINFNTLAANNGLSQGENVFYLWDPSLAGANNVGAWVTLAYNGSSYDRTVIGPNDYSTAGGLQGIDQFGTIQSSAAFMMDFGAVSKTINFNENIKTAGSSNLLFRPVRQKQIRTNLLAESKAAGTFLLADGVLSTFKPSYTNSVDGLDIKKLPNFAENFGILREGKTFAIERRKPIRQVDTIFYKLEQVRLKNYQLELIPDKMDEINLSAWLKDNYLNTTIPVSLVDTTLVPFSVTGETGAKSATRFSLIFKKWINAITISSTKNNCRNTLISWQVSNQENINRYEVERSYGENEFILTKTILPSSSNAYSWLDENLQRGKYAYRIKCISNNGVIAFSNFTKVWIEKNCREPYVFPNPVRNGKIFLQMEELPAGMYIATLFNQQGQAISNIDFVYKGDNTPQQLTISKQLPSGIYRLELVGAAKQRMILQLMIDSE